MRIVLFIAWIIIGLYTMVNMYEFSTQEKEEIQQVIQGKTLQEKIIVPPGLEKEYEQIMKGEHPFSEEKKEKVVEQKQD